MYFPNTENLNAVYQKHLSSTLADFRKHTKTLFSIFAFKNYPKKTRLFFQEWKTILKAMSKHPQEIENTSERGSMCVAVWMLMAPVIWKNRQMVGSV